MRIDIITNAAYSRYGSEVPPFDIAFGLAQHDVDFAKPALLLGESVVLHSGNLITAHQIRNRISHLRMPMRAVYLILRLSCSPHRDRLIEISGLNESQFIPATVASSFLSADLEAFESTGQGLPFENLKALIDDHSATFDVTPTALAHYFHEELLAVLDPGLKPAVDEGVLTITSLTKTVPDVTVHKTVGENLETELDIDDYFQLAIDDLWDLLEEPAILPVLDPWSSEVAEALGQDELASRFDTANSLGLQLLSGLPTIRMATVSEILDMRRELRTPLIKFRGEMMTAADRFEAIKDPIDIKQFVSELRVTTINPALAEIEDKIESNTYLNELLKMPGEIRDIVATGGLLLASTSVLGASIGSIAAVAVGVPILSAGAKKRMKSREIRQNRFYLLNHLGDRAT